MDNAVYLLYETACSAMRAMTFIKVTMIFKNVCSNPYTYRLMILLQDVYRQSLVTIQNLQSAKEKENTKDSAHILYETGSMMDEMHIMLDRTLLSIIPEENRALLNLEIKHILRLLTDLAPYMQQIFGSRESLFVVTPDFQAKSGLW